jgi:hypothetical protein
MREPSGLCQQTGAGRQARSSALASLDAPESLELFSNPRDFVLEARQVLAQVLLVPP